jgi:hypothetical protein
MYFQNDFLTAILVGMELDFNQIHPFPYCEYK